MTPLLQLPDRVPDEFAEPYHVAPPRGEDLPPTLHPVNIQLVGQRAEAEKRKADAERLRADQAIQQSAVLKTELERTKLGS